MKILFCSYRFWPDIGGIETVGRILAREFAARGHELCLVTQSEGPEREEFTVVRKPGLVALWRLARWSDIVFHNNLSLRFAWPLLAVRRPWVVAHHTWIQRPDGTKALADRVKLAALKRAANISVSAAIARSLPVPSSVIPDPYDPEIFHVERGIPRDRDLVFVGRLVSDKGVDILLDALHQLDLGGLAPVLSVVGDGPERQRLQDQAQNLGLAGRITFHGGMAGRELARLLNRHRVLVVPSRWHEPFGVVALEGIACGCVVVGTSGGGLPEAIGPCGRTVPNGSAEALAGALRAVLANEETRQAFLAKAEAHLKPHQPEAVAQKYLRLFELSRRVQ